MFGSRRGIALAYGEDIDSQDAIREKENAMESVQPNLRQNRGLLWLRFCGFQPDQMTRLIELKERYRKQRDTFDQSEMKRLAFARWLHQHGLIAG